MSKPAELSRSDLAKKLWIKLLLLALPVLLLARMVIPDYAVSVAYGLIIFLLNYLVFALYVFRYAGSRSSVLMLQSYSRGVFVKLLLFALAFILVFYFDKRASEALQVAAIIVSYFFMQLVQIGFSVALAKKL